MRIAIIQNEAAEPFGSLAKARIYAAYSAIPQKPRNVLRRDPLRSPTGDISSKHAAFTLAFAAARRLAAATAFVVVV
ncbi:MAG: hypothetical protein ACLTQI_05080 [Slackia sp.]